MAKIKKCEKDNEQIFKYKFELLKLLLIKESNEQLDLRDKKLKKHLLEENILFKNIIKKDKYISYEANEEVEETLKIVEDLLNLDIEKDEAHKKLFMLFQKVFDQGILFEKNNKSLNHLEEN